MVVGTDSETQFWERGAHMGGVNRSLGGRAVPSQGVALMGSGETVRFSHWSEQWVEDPCPPAVCAPRSGPLPRTRVPRALAPAQGVSALAWPPALWRGCGEGPGGGRARAHTGWGVLRCGLEATARVGGAQRAEVCGKVLGWGGGSPPHWPDSGPGAPVHHGGVLLQLRG